MTEIEKATIGYDLDMAGCQFEESEEEELKGCLVFDGPNRLAIEEFFPWIRDASSIDGIPVYVFKPSEFIGERHDWPIVFGTWRLAGHGRVNETDRDCICFGHEEGDQWVPTSNILDKPFPKCSRCEGSGSVMSPGGYWALYYV